MQTRREDSGGERKSVYLVDDDVSFVIKQMHQDPTLAAYLKQQIIQRKKGLGRYLLTL